MDLFWNGPVEGLHVYTWIAAILLGNGVHVARMRERSLAALVESALVLTTTIVGLIGVTSAVVHLGWAEEMAASIGWDPSPFQTEVAFANLALGAIAAGVLFARAWVAPAILGKTLFAWGAAWTHLGDYFTTGNTAANNTGPILWWDLLMPVVLITLLVAHRRLGPTGAI